MNNLKIRKYKKGDENGFFKLDRKLEEHPFNRRNKPNFMWKYKGKNPFGKSISYFAEYKKQIIAHFAAIPLGWKIRSKNILGGCSIAMMVHPDWQSKGLIKFVGDEVMKDLLNNDVSFIYGYPNDKAYNLHKNIWRYDDAFDQNLYSIKKEKIKNFFYKGYIFKKVSKFGKTYDDFWNKYYKRYQYILDRNSKFLNWRYADRPDQRYFLNLIFKEKELEGYFILKKYTQKKKTTIHIIDIFSKVQDQKKTNLLILAINAFIKKEFSNFLDISLWLNGSKKFQNSLKNAGYQISSSRKMIYKKIKKNNINFKNMYFTMGDTLEIY